ncbi:hypothetical protein COD13_29035 [Priestia megaterium]|uniref:hypothetical protein n=1 Tax=Priestia megaterium TaxID=1404 RepID=UPI000BFB1B57|nr:hypothetical protein [Priestia megaterium]PGT49816.1 hypothetical protein COD13_29035 [Priestia megaterium]
MENAKMFDKGSYENALKYMDRYLQKKHLKKVSKKWGFKNTTKLMDMFEDIIRSVQVGVIDGDDFRGWLSKSQIDGNNHHFVFEGEFIDVNELKFQQLINNMNQNTESILDINEENLTETKLIYVFKLEHKYVLAFLSPAEITVRQNLEDGSFRYNQEKVVYPAYLEFDFKHNNIIVVLNPTSNLSHVNGIQPGGRQNNFASIADFFLEQARGIVGSFHVRKPVWLPNALFNLAEDLSYHNNPEVEQLSLKMEDSIKKFSQNLMEQSGISDIALVDSLSSEIQDSYISALQEEFGENNSDDTYRVFMQKTDQASTSVAVESKVDNLTSGVVGRIAKQSRQDSDVKMIGLEVKLDEKTMYRFRIEDGPDHILIRPSNRFTEEEVVQNVLSKLRQYKDGIPNR